MAKAKWTTVRLDEIEEVHYNGPHRWKAFKSKFLNWPYCGMCGMILLNNDVCQKRAKRRCTG